jgi:phosphomannomutase/phosphoglucomutase
LRRLFGTDGIRGVIGETMTADLALRLGKAIGAYFGKGSRVLLGRDVRAGGHMIAFSVASGLISEGVKVYYVDLVPTPAIQYNVKYLGFDGAVMVTASHNPPEYNGIKVIGSDGIEIPREDERLIEELYFKGVPSKIAWRSLTEEYALRIDILENYVNAIVSHVDVDKIKKMSFKVVVDCANSVGSLTTPWVLRRLGVKTISLNCHLDPLFPGREPEPTPQSLALASDVVKLTKADLGIGHDGDADRAILITDKGEVLWGDRSGTLLAEFVAEVRKDLPKKVYTAVSSSILVEQYLKPRGIEVIWTPVGSVGISRKIIEEGGAIAGFEENGGYMYPPHHPVRDGAMKLALTLYMLAERRVRLSELVSRLPKYYPIKEKIPTTPEFSECALKAVSEFFSEYRQITIDGVKVLGEDFWVLVRPSGTEPVLRIMLEASNKEKAEELKNKVLNVIKSRCAPGVRR